MADHSKFQMASKAGGTWKTVWKVDLPFGKIDFITIEGGVTNVMPNYHQAIINVLVRQIDLKGGAEDVSSEQITVLVKDFVDEDEAVDFIRSKRKEV